MKKSKMKRTTKRNIVNGFIYVSLTALSLTMLFPFFWMITTSIKEKSDAIKMPIQWIPDPIVFDEYIEIWSKVPLLTGIINTFKIAIPVILCGTFVSALAAFAFSKMDIPKKGTLFFILLATMMIPGEVTMFPKYVVWGKLGAVDTLIPLIVPGMMGNMGMMFFLRQFLNGMPKEYVEAARIDGAGWMKTFLTIFLPLMKPALATQIIFWFMGIWNNFLAPLLYIDSESKFTVQLAMRLLSSTSEAVNEYPLIMTGAVISCAPLLLLYVCFQKYFTDSMVISGVKG